MRHYPLCILIILAGLAGCQHLPQTAAPGGDLPAGAPAPGEVLADLTAPDRAVANFSSSGTIRMRLPGQAATQRFDRSHVRYLRPGRFYARAFKVGQSVNIYADGPVFLLDVPQEQTFYYGREGDRFEDVALDIAPSLIFREFFLVDALRGVAEESLRILEYDPKTRRAVVAVFAADRPRRLERELVVAPGPEGWFVAESTLFDRDGSRRARTVYENYGRVDGVYMAGKTTSFLPDGDGELSFEIQSNPQVNRAEPRPVEDVEDVRRDLLSRGFREVRGAREESER